MKTIVCCTQKGGVSKTTTCEAIILYLRKQGYKVLALDLDLQGNLTSYLNSEAKYDAFDVCLGKVKIEKAIEEDLIAGGGNLAYLNQFFDTNPMSTIKKKLKEVSTKYDVCVIDTPPAINKTVLAALVAADYVIMPSEPTRDALDGILQTLEAVKSVQSSQNKNLEVLGVLMVKYKERYTVHKQFLNYCVKSKKFPVFTTKVRESQAVNNAKTEGVSFFDKEYMKANAVKDYWNFAKEVEKKIGLKK